MHPIFLLPVALFGMLGFILRACWQAITRFLNHIIGAFRSPKDHPDKHLFQLIAACDVYAGRPTTDSGKQLLCAKAKGIVDDLRCRRSANVEIDKMRLEQMTLLLVPDEELSSYSRIIHHRYRRIVGDSGYRDIGFAPGNKSTAELRGELMSILVDIHNRHSIYRKPIITFNRLFSQAYWMLVTATVCLFLMDLCLINKDWRWSPPWTVSYLGSVACAGCWGAAISISYRTRILLYSSIDPIQFSDTLKCGKKSVYMSLLSGGFFAFLVYLLIASGLVQNRFLPVLAIHPKAEPIESRLGYIFADSVDWLHGKLTSRRGDEAPHKTDTLVGMPGPRLVYPVSAGDYAALLLFCFLGGFAERTIPDSLDRLVEKVRKDMGK